MLCDRSFGFVAAGLYGKEAGKFCFPTYSESSDAGVRSKFEGIAVLNDLPEIRNPVSKGTYLPGFWHHLFSPKQCARALVKSKINCT